MSVRLYDERAVSLPWVGDVSVALSLLYHHYLYQIRTHVFSGGEVN
jgi:hypothetical protein